MSVTVTLQGFDALEQALAQFTNASARNILRRACFAALEPVAEDARQRVPKDTGQLRDAIAVSAKLVRTAGNRAFHRAMRDGLGRALAVQAMRNAQRDSGRSHVEIYLGTTPAAPHAHLVEFGSVNHGPQPFIRPAWDNGKTQVLDDLKTALTDEIAKATVRAQRRAANAAARAARAAAPAAPAPSTPTPRVP